MTLCLSSLIRLKRGNNVCKLHPKDGQSPRLKKVSLCGIPTKRMKPTPSAPHSPAGFGRPDAPAAAANLGVKEGSRGGRRRIPHRGRGCPACLGGKYSRRSSRDAAANGRLTAAVTTLSVDPTLPRAPYRCSLRSRCS